MTSGVHDVAQQMWGLAEPAKPSCGVCSQTRSRTDRIWSRPTQACVRVQPSRRGRPNDHLPDAATMVNSWLAISSPSRVRSTARYWPGSRGIAVHDQVRKRGAVLT